MKKFKEQFLVGTTKIGTFVKTPDPIIFEVLKKTGLDFVVVDAEHAPFGRKEIDTCLMVCKLLQLPALVRIQNTRPETILNALDCGAVGIQVPHVKTASEAERIIKFATYGEGGRGYAGSTRAAGFGSTPIAEHMKNSEKPLIIVQIEDPQGVDEIESIAAVPGISALFIGCVDLTVAYGETDLNSGKVMEAGEKIYNAGKKNCLPVGTFLPNTKDIKTWKKKGVSIFAIASEHAMILQGFRKIIKETQN